MKKRHWLGWGLVSTLWIGVVGLAALAPDADAGKQVYQRRCKMCHGIDGKGSAAVARMMKVEIPALDSDAVQEQTDEELAKVITKGKGKMVAVKGISEQDVANVIAYLRTLAKKP
ncbi:MAG: hypothetical protein Kow00109_09050 [Acidobacteriota bacterium]